MRSVSVVTQHAGSCFVPLRIREQIVDLCRCEADDDLGL